MREICVGSERSNSKQVQVGMEGFLPTLPKERCVFDSIVVYLIAPQRLEPNWLRMMMMMVVMMMVLVMMMMVIVMVMVMTMMMMVMLMVMVVVMVMVMIRVIVMVMMTMVMVIMMVIVKMFIPTQWSISPASLQN